MFDHLTNEGLLDSMYIDYRTFVNGSVWSVFLKNTYRDKAEYNYEVWRKWLRT